MDKNNENISLSNSLHQVANVLLTGDRFTDYKEKEQETDSDSKLRNKMRDNHQRSMIIFFGGIFVLFVSAILGGSFIGILLRIILVFTAVMIFGKYITATMKQGKEIEKEYQEKYVAKAIHDIMPDAIYKYSYAEYAKDYTTQASKFHNLGIISRYDDVKGSAMTLFERDNKQCMFCNLKLNTEYTDEDGDTHTQTVFKGQIYALPCKGNVKGRTRILSTTKSKILKKEKIGNFPRKDKQEQRVDFESREFNDNFECYTTDAESAFYMMNPLVMEHVLKLKEIYGTIGISIADNMIYLSFHNEKQLFKTPSDYKEISMVSTENSIKEVQKVFKLVQDLADAINGKVS